MSALTTHVLDLTHGAPAVGMRIVLHASHEDGAAGPRFMLTAKGQAHIAAGRDSGERLAAICAQGYGAGREHCTYALKQGYVDAVGPMMATTNADGRCDKPLLSGAALTVGRYRLEFHVADYFRTKDVDLPDPPFLDVVVIDFGVSDPSKHHHVPLLVSPYGYSTYRGS